MFERPCAFYTTSNTPREQILKQSMSPALLIVPGSKEKGNLISSTDAEDTSTHSSHDLDSTVQYSTASYRHLVSVSRRPAPRRFPTRDQVGGSPLRGWRAAAGGCSGVLTLNVLCPQGCGYGPFERVKQHTGQLLRHQKFWKQS